MHLRETSLDADLPDKDLKKSINDVKEKMQDMRMILEEYYDHNEGKNECKMSVLRDKLTQQTNDVLYVSKKSKLCWMDVMPTYSQETQEVKC